MRERYVECFGGIEKEFIARLRGVIFEGRLSGLVVNAENELGQESEMGGSVRYAIVDFLVFVQYFMFYYYGLFKVDEIENFFKFGGWCVF